MKSGKRHLTEWIELPNQGTIRTLWEKETHKYLYILKADRIKNVEMKKIGKSIPWEPESYSRQNYIVET